MKKIFLYFFALAATVACNRVEVDDNLSLDGKELASGMITEIISGSQGSSTKASINADASFSWTAGDNVAVHVSNGTYVFTSDQGAEGAHVDAEHPNQATFKVVYEAGYSRDYFAIYPSTIVSSEAAAASYGQDADHPLVVTLPSSYTLAQVSGTNGTTSPCPMISTNEATSTGWDFYQLCSLLRLTVSNIPATAKRLEIDFDGKKVAGNFAIPSPVKGDGTSTIAMGKASGSNSSVITIKKDGSDAELGATSLVLNIPLPTGTYSNISIYAYDALTGGAAVMEGTAEFPYEAVNTKGVKKAVGLINPPYKIKFTNNNTELTNVRFVRIFSCQNKLHNGETTYGPFTTSSETNLSSPITADLTFDAVAGDQIAFQVVDANGNVYSALTDAPLRKTATVEVTRYTFTVGSGKKVCFSPGDLGKSSSGYSFTEPFTNWGTTATKVNYTGDRSWFDHGEVDSASDPATSLYGITWRIETRASATAPYEWDYIVGNGTANGGGRSMSTGVSRYYKVTVNGHANCLLLPPDEATSEDIGTDIDNGSVGTDYVKYLGKGFVLLMDAKRASAASTSSTAKLTWPSNAPYAYWMEYQNGTNRKEFIWKADDEPKVDWPTSRFRMHVRLIHDVE